MLKAFYKKVNFVTEVDVEFMLGKPAPIFADWITTVIPFWVDDEDERFQNSTQKYKIKRIVYLHVQEGKLVEVSFEKPDNLKEDNTPGCFTHSKWDSFLSDKFTFSEEKMFRLEKEDLKALKRAVFKISPFRFGKNKPS